MLKAAVPAQSSLSSRLSVQQRNVPGPCQILSEEENLYIKKIYFVLKKHLKNHLASTQEILCGKCNGTAASSAENESEQTPFLYFELFCFTYSNDNLPFGWGSP